jgi:hypothetical protein
MRRALVLLLFALLLTARARPAAAQPPEPSQVAVQTCTALLTAYGQIPFCTTQVVDSAEFERQIEAFFTNGAAVMAMPETGPGAAYYHDAARVLALPTQNWGIASSPVIAPISSERGMATSMPAPAATSSPPAPAPTAASTTAEAERLQEMMSQAQEIVSRAREVMAQAQETASRAEEAASRAEERASRAQEAPPQPFSSGSGETPRETSRPVASPSDSVSEPALDLGKVAISPAREPVVPEGRAPRPTVTTAPLPGRNLEPLWAVVVAAGLIAATLIYVVATLIQRHRPLHGRHV